MKVLAYCLMKYSGQLPLPNSPLPPARILDPEFHLNCIGLYRYTSLFLRQILPFLVRIRILSPEWSQSIIIQLYWNVSWYMPSPPPLPSYNGSWAPPFFSSIPVMGSKSIMTSIDWISIELTYLRIFRAGNSGTSGISRIWRGNASSVPS